MMPSLTTLRADLDRLVARVVAGRYRLDALIGMGAMGAVFRGSHIGLQRSVAIKVLHPLLTADPRLCARFDREAHGASRLDHRNCVRTFDTGTTEDGIKFIAMELLEGVELMSLLGQRWSPGRAIHAGMQIFAGLEHAHERGVVHRDLKPENVFVANDADGIAYKLLDFGIAKIQSGHDPGRAVTRVGAVVGTPLYMSPEQASGADVDERTDLYSAGVMLYEMLAGCPPFQNDDGTALVRSHILATVPPLPADVPGPLAALVIELLHKHPDARPPNAAAVRRRLQAMQPVVADTLVMTTPVPAPEPAPEPDHPLADWRSADYGDLDERATQAPPRLLPRFSLARPLLIVSLLWLIALGSVATWGALGLTPNEAAAAIEEPALAQMPAIAKAMHGRVLARAEATDATAEPIVAAVVEPHAGVATSPRPETPAERIVADEPAPRATASEPTKPVTKRSRRRRSRPKRSTTPTPTLQPKARNLGELLPSRDRRTRLPSRPGRREGTSPKRTRRLVPLRPPRRRKAS